MITIRNETEPDYPLVEDLTRRGFYNQYMPWCVEHYLVRAMRGHEDFIPELKKEHRPSQEEFYIISQSFLA